MQRSKGNENGMDSANFLKGAFWIAFGGFAAKIIGALYRIPLTSVTKNYYITSMKPSIKLLLR